MLTPMRVKGYALALRLDELHSGRNSLLPEHSIEDGRARRSPDMTIGCTRMSGKPIECTITTRESPEGLHGPVVFLWLPDEPTVSDSLSSSDCGLCLGSLHTCVI